MLEFPIDKPLRAYGGDLDYAKRIALNLVSDTRSSVFQFFSNPNPAYNNQRTFLLLFYPRSV